MQTLILSSNPNISVSHTWPGLLHYLHHALCCLDALVHQLSGHS